MQDLRGQFGVITGGTGGIGRAIAHALAAEGVHLWLMGRNAEQLDHLSRELQNTYANVRARAVLLDFGDDIEREASTIAAEVPAVDILVHSAGGIVLKSIAETTAAEFDGQYRANVRGPFLLTKALLPALKRQKGQVVFVNSSVVQQKSRANLSAYTASKSALMAFADSLREEVNGVGVRVLSVYPGRTASRMQQAVHAFEGKPYRAAVLLQPQDIACTVIAALKLPRTAEISDIAIRPFEKS